MKPAMFMRIPTRRWSPYLRGSFLVSLFLFCGASLTRCDAQSPQGTPSPESESRNSESTDTSKQEYLHAVQAMRKEAGIPEPGTSSHPEASSLTPANSETFPGITILTGTEGIPFPDPSTVIVRPFPTADSLALETPQPEPIPTPWQKPGRCQNNQTVRVERSAEDTDAEVITDTLFIDHELVPSDPQEVFGARTDLYPYGGEEDSGTSVRMELYEVPCVPYRIRITRHSYFYDSGLNALKNYDKNYAGKGEFHPLVEQKLFGRKRVGFTEHAGGKR